MLIKKIAASSCLLAFSAFAAPEALQLSVQQVSCEANECYGSTNEKKRNRESADACTKDLHS